MVQIAFAQGSDNPNEEKLVTIHAEDAYLPSILSILIEKVDTILLLIQMLNVTQLTIHLDDVPIQQAINLVVRAVGLSYEIVGNSFHS